MYTSDFGGVLPGQLHRVLIQEVNGDYPTTISYKSSEEIVLHISIRLSMELIVLNSFLEGTWMTEHRVPIGPSFRNVNTELRIQFDTKYAYIWLGDDAEVVIPLERPLHVIQEIQCDGEHKLEVLGRRATNELNATADEHSALPEYAKPVLEEFERVRLETVKRSGLPLPDRRNPIVVSVVKDELDKLADFFRHYRKLGIDRFVMIDNGSSDGSREFLMAQSDTDVIDHPLKFNWILKQGWINRVIRTYGYERWYIYADADEHIVFEGLGERTFRDVVVEMETRNVSRVRGLLVDMYRPGPVLHSDHVAHGALAESYAYFDKLTYKEVINNEYISVTGGPRKRVFGSNSSIFGPELTKYPLFRLNKDELMINPHRIWPFEANFSSPRFLGILHFKFLPSSVKKIERAVSERNYWNDSMEYGFYLRSFRENPSLTLFADCSCPYEGPTSLLRSGVIRPIGWPEVSSLADFARMRARAAFGRRTAELREDEAMTRFAAS